MNNDLILMNIPSKKNILGLPSSLIERNFDPSPPLIDDSLHSTNSPFPDFTEQGKTLQDMVKQGICDSNGNPIDDDGICCLSLIPDPSETAYRNLSNFLLEKRKLLIDASSETEERVLTFTFQLIYFFNHLMKDCVNQEFEYIGSDLYACLGPDPFIEFAKGYFPKTAPSFFENLFKNEYLMKRFNQKGKDIDVRIYTPGDINIQREMSDKTIQFFSPAISSFPYIFSEKLKTKKPRSTFSKTNIPAASIIEFATIKQRFIKKKKTQYAIRSFLTQNEQNEIEAIDFLFVSSLEHRNLSTKNCMALSLTDFMEKGIIEINTYPFSGRKALIDILLGIATVKAPTVDAWLRFVRDCDRSLQKKEEKIEAQMVFNVINYQKEFEKQTKKKYESLVDFLFSLFEREMLKTQALSIKKFHDKKLVQSFDPHLTIPFLFRACQSLSLHSAVTDSECLLLWKKADLAGWIKPKEEEGESDWIAQLKIALVDEKIPFSIISAWIGILAWGLKPRTATTHHETPVFHLLEPIRCLIPIDPLSQGNAVQHYFSRHCDSPALTRIYTGFLNHDSNPSPLISWYLAPLFMRLAYQKMVENWIYHPSSLLNQMGFQLFLTQNCLIPSPRFGAAILDKLADWLSSSSLEFQKNAAGRMVFLLPEFDFLFKEITFLDEILSTEKWLILLREAHKEELLPIALAIWQRSEKRGLSLTQEGWSLFKLLLKKHPPLALTLFEQLRPCCQIKEAAPIHRLLKSFSSQGSNSIVPYLKRLLRLIHPLFENERIQNTCAAELKFFIDAFSLDPSQMGITHLLLQIKAHELFSQPWLTDKWLETLEKLIHSTPAKAFCLYQIAREQNQIVLYEENLLRIRHLQTFMGKALYGQSQDFSFRLLKLHCEENSEKEPSIEIHSWFWEMFNHYSVNITLKKFPKDLLTIGLLFLNNNNAAKMNLMFSSYIQCAIDNCFCDPFIDDLLLDPGMKKLYSFSKNEWSPLLLNYLKKSLFPCKNNQYSKLWGILLQVKDLFAENFAQELENLTFAECTAKLYCESPAYLAQQQTWVRHKHPLLLEKLWKDSSFLLLEQLLLSLITRDKITPSSFVWRLCSQQLNESVKDKREENIEYTQEKSNGFQTLFLLIQALPFEDLKKHISKNDIKIVESLIETFFNQKEFNVKQWRELLIHLSPVKGSKTLIKHKKNLKTAPPLILNKTLLASPLVEPKKMPQEAPSFSLVETFNFLEQIIAQKNRTQLQKSKPQFLQLIPQFLKSENIGIAKTQKMVTKAFTIKWMVNDKEITWLLSEEKSKLCFLIFEAQTLNSPLENTIQLYLKWAPLFFASEYHLKAAIKRVALQIDQNSKDTLIKIFSIRDRIPSTVPSYKHCRTFYPQWLLDELALSKAGRALAPECFEYYVEGKMTSPCKDNLSKEETIDLFELLIHRFPFGDSDHLIHRKMNGQTTREKYIFLLEGATKIEFLYQNKKNELYTNQGRYISHACWLGHFPTSTFPLLNKNKETMIIPIIKSNIERYLKIKTHLATHSAIELLGFLQMQMDLNNFNKNLTIYKNILNQINNLQIPNNNNNKENNLQTFENFKNLFQYTFLKPLKDPSNELHITQLNKLYYPFVKKILQIFWNNSFVQHDSLKEKELCISFGYCLDIFFILLNYREAKMDKSDLLEELKFLLPFVAKLGTSLENEWILTKVPFQFPKNVVNEFLHFLIQSNIILKRNHVQEIRKILFAWLNLILEDESPLSLDCLILTLVHLYRLTKELKIKKEKNDLMHTSQEDSCLLMQKIKKRFHSASTTHQLYFDLFFLVFDKDNPNSCVKDALEKMLDCLKELTESNDLLIDDLACHLDLSKKLYLELFPYLENSQLGFFHAPELNGTNNKLSVEDGISGPFNPKENAAIFEKFLSAWKTLLQRSGTLSWCPIVEECQQFSCSLLKHGIDEGWIIQSELNGSSYPLFQWFDNWITETGKYSCCMGVLRLKISGEDKSEEAIIKNTMHLLDPLGSCFIESLPSPRAQWILDFVNGLPEQMRQEFFYKWGN